MSTTTVESKSGSQRSGYAKEYQAARSKAVQALIKQHPQDWQRLFADAKRQHGIADAGERRLAKSKAKAADMIAALKAQGVDVSDLIG